MDFVFMKTVEIPDKKVVVCEGMYVKAT
jgi:hypothetical protein